MPEMGSLVIRPAVSDIGQYPRPPHMPTAESHTESHPESLHVAPAQTTRSSAPSFPPRASSTSSRPAVSRQVEEGSRNATPVAAVQPQIQEPVGGRPMESTRSPAQAARAHPSLQWSQHNRGFDQSGFPLSSAPQGLTGSSPSSPRLLPTIRSTRSLGGSEATSPSRIKIRDLSQIQSFASEEAVSRSRVPRRTPSALFDSGRQYEISEMPVNDIIEMVAGLLAKITATNDRQHDHVHRPISQEEDSPPLSAQTTSVLAFHGKNVPSISILSYLSRIHKYCPTTYEVFLSLLVYFDRMTEAVNRMFVQSMRREVARTISNPLTPPSPSQPTSPGQRSPRERRTTPAETSPRRRASFSGHSTLPSGHDDLARFFVVDSYNIHRLVIAAVTCASKFFSDVFYTNSRYAKVGGLPLAELNHLELQFLLLNDFRLSIPVEELEAYGTFLVEFYAREVVAQQTAGQAAHAGRVRAQQRDTVQEDAEGEEETEKSQEGSDVYMRDSSAGPPGPREQRSR